MTTTPPSPHHLLRILTTAFAAVGLIALLTGCELLGSSGGPKTSGPPTAIVVGNTALAQPFSATDPFITQLSTDTVARRSTTQVIPVDGAPQAGRALSFADHADNPLRRELQDRAYVGTMIAAIVGARPTSPEADYLAAIAAGCRAVQGGERGALTVLGDGLSTVTLRLQDGLLTNAIPVSTIVDQLAGRHAIPDLRHCPTIRWAALGQTAAPQTPLTIPARARLEQLYQAIIARGGGRVSFVEAPVTAGPPRTSQPPVTPVPVSAVGPIGILTSGQVGFRPGQAVLRDPAAAAVALRALATRIEDLRPAQLWVIGTTSSENDSVALSTARAQTIVDLLTGTYGVTVPLHATGLGSHFRGYVEDRNADGSLNEAKARQNRLVIVTTDRASAQPTA